MLKKKWILIANVALSLCSAVAQERTPHVSPEQTEFSAEDGAVKSPVRIPDDAWAILAADESVRSSLSSNQVSRSWFSAAVVHLHDSHENDLVVEGEGGLRGTNVNPFWVFRATPNGMRLAVNGPAHDLIVQPTRYKGYKTILLMWFTAVRYSEVSLRFDGEKYVEYLHHEGEIK